MPAYAGMTKKARERLRITKMEKGAAPGNGPLCHASLAGHSPSNARITNATNYQRY